MGAKTKSEFRTYFLIAQDEFSNIFVVDGFSTKRQAIKECGEKKKYYGVIEGTGSEFYPGDYINKLQFKYRCVYARPL